MISQPVSSQVLSITLAWLMPFALLHSCVFSEKPFETSYISSNSERKISSPAPSVCPTHSIALLLSPFAQPASCLCASVKGVTVPAHHVLLLAVFGAYLQYFDPLFYVRKESHAYLGGDQMRHCVRCKAATLNKMSRKPFLLCRWRSMPAWPSPSASSAHEFGRRYTPALGPVTIFGCLRPEHHQGRGQAEGGTFKVPAHATAVGF